MMKTGRPCLIYFGAGDGPGFLPRLPEGGEDALRRRIDVVHPLRSDAKDRVVQDPNMPLGAITEVLNQL
tara:strand:+ start:8879 stop:9085 length:207 start_codon:yes stop_codon:yes gene_type:complete